MKSLACSRADSARERAFCPRHLLDRGQDGVRVGHGVRSVVEEHFDDRLRHALAYLLREGLGQNLLIVELLADGGCNGVELFRAGERLRPDHRVGLAKVPFLRQGSHRDGGDVGLVDVGLGKTWRTGPYTTFPLRTECAQTFKLLPKVPGRRTVARMPPFATACSMARWWSALGIARVFLGDDALTAELS